MKILTKKEEDDLLFRRSNILVASLGIRYDVSSLKYLLETLENNTIDPESRIDSVKRILKDIQDNVKTIETACKLVN